MDGREGIESETRPFFFFLGARLPVLFWGNLVVTRALEGVRLDLVHAVSTDTS